MWRYIVHSIQGYRTNLQTNVLQLKAFLWLADITAISAILQFRHGKKRNKITKKYLQCHKSHKTRNSIQVILFFFGHHNFLQRHPVRKCFLLPFTTACITSKFFSFRRENSGFITIFCFAILEIYLKTTASLASLS